METYGVLDRSYGRPSKRLIHKSFAARRGSGTLPAHIHEFKQQKQIIPREVELPGEDAIMPKEGDHLIIGPAPPKSLLQVLATLTPIDEEFPPLRDLPPEPVEL